jgi:hypothetical protein
MMGSMQLSAIGLHGWISGAACCCGISLTTGTFLICAALLARGTVALLEIGGLRRVFFYSYTLESDNPFLYIAFALLFLGGIGDIVAALCGAIGASHTKVIPSMVLPVWLLIHTGGAVIFTMIVSSLDTMAIGSGVTVVYLLFWLVLPDMYFTLITLQNLLKVTWHGTVAPSTVSILYGAENLAVKYGSTTKEKNHLITAILMDFESKQLLEYAGVDVAKMEHELAAGTSHLLAGEKFGVDEIYDACDPLPFSPDATELLAEAAREQWKAFQPKLTADHLLLALTKHGSITLMPKGKRLFQHRGRVVSDDGVPCHFPVPHAKAIRDFIEAAAREQSIEPGPPPAPAFGYLPLEECVMAYIGVQVFLCALSVILLVVLNRSLGTLIGLRTVQEMRTLELLSSALGFALGSTAFYFIMRHRQARREIRLEAFEKGCRWSADLQEAWEAVRHSDRASGWLKQLKEGSYYLSLNLGWNFVQLFVDVPVLFSVIIFGNVCGSYHFGLMKASSPRLQDLAPVHCTASDVVLLLTLASWVGVKLYMSWCQFALWHEYSYGWTTTELRGVAYLDPLAPLPKEKIRRLAGLPKVPQSRLGDPVNERTPLLL